IFRAVLAPPPGRADAADEIERGVELCRQLDRDFAIADAEGVVVHGMVLAVERKGVAIKIVARLKSGSDCPQHVYSPGLTTASYAYKDMFICQPDIVASERNGTPAHTDAHDCPPTVRGALRCPQGRRRGHAAAHPGAAGGGGTDRLGSHRHPAPIAAAHFPPSAAPRPGRAGRALPRRLVGVLPPGRAGGCRQACPRTRFPPSPPPP